MSLDLCLTRKKQKQKQNPEAAGVLFVCAISLACSACCLSRIFQNVSFSSEAAIFIYLRIPERVGVQVNLPNASLHFRHYKGKKTPLLRKHSKCSAPQRCSFYLFLFIFLYLIRTSMVYCLAVIFLWVFFSFSLVNCWYLLVSILHICVSFVYWGLGIV